MSRLRFFSSSCRFVFFFSPPWFSNLQTDSTGSFVLSVWDSTVVSPVGHCRFLQRRKTHHEPKKAATWLLFIFPPVEDYTKTMRRTAGKGTVNAVCLCAWFCASVFLEPKLFMANWLNLSTQFWFPVGNVFKFL